MSNKTQPEASEPLIPDQLASWLIVSEVNRIVGDIASELQGKLLTIIDASVQDPIQRKAQKDIVSQSMWDSIRVLQNSVRNLGYHIALGLKAHSNEASNPDSLEEFIKDIYSMNGMQPVSVTSHNFQKKLEDAKLA